MISPAASADQNPGYPGSCGRCYTVRCKPGPVLDNDGQPIRIIYPFFENGTQSSVGYFNGDYLRPYLPSINSDVKDSFGKAFPGNPGHIGPTGDSEDGGIVDVQCDPSINVTVIIADSCPCKQVLSEDAPGVAPGGEVRRQEWCCGPTASGGPTSHFDISWRAMEYLAHPLFGAINLEYVPIQDGFQPFDGAQAIHFSIKLTGSASDKVDAAAVPALKLFVIVDELIESSLQDGEPVREEVKKYCNVEAFLDTSETSAPNGELQTGEDQDNGWIPLSSLECEEAGVPVKELNRMDFQNVIDSDVEFCLTDLEIVM
ncbi:hypothetical protein DUNSADRAFT_12764 [Dunaliella salina]|uniref:Expansin-like EG45 domain-containing protein n=1 Tax=Dunaliella salina TaxID=3046 RepID=A0ABQ7GAM8_DUNSA|nr:hypothetical protein DUNSADRAFT_12764 [Dunaliella salina]|eukprot:KAF5831660.1 hypothetical protein DUNSADRAFT_12764 [Dunaliella salina]